MPLTESSLSPEHRPLALLIHGLHKSGTMFLYQLFFRLCRDRQIPFFSANHPCPNDHLVTPDFSGEFCLGPIRTFDTSPVVASPSHRLQRIFQVRDPRDVLVSQFHSFGWSHTDDEFDDDQIRWRSQIRDMSIDEYVLNPVCAVEPLLRKYSHLVSRQTGEFEHLVRYEQMVTDFPGWLSQIVPLLEFPRPAWTRFKYGIKYRNEFRPGKHPAAHKRHVAPGEFRHSLQPRTVQQLTDRFQPVLTALDYPLD